MKKLNPILLGLLLLCALVAELYRFHGFLLLDLVAPPALLLWLALHKKHIIWPNYTLPAILFTAIGLASLLLHRSLSNADFIQGAFYGLRWISLCGLSLIAMNTKSQTAIWKILLTFSLLLAVAGFLQLYFVPDFTAYETLGWDPHQGRLLATWFDPNFVGAYFAFFIPLLLGHAWDNKKSRPVTVPILALLALALALTLSRSAYLALLLGLGIFGLLRSIKMLAAGALFLVVLGVFAAPVRDRFESLLQNIAAVTTDDYTLPDASARLRYHSWETGWNLFLESPLFGQGYNAYKPAALEQKLIVDPTSHAATGSDASLLTVLATTGLAGFLPFLSVYALLLLAAWKNRASSVQLGYFSGLTGLLVSSIFVNSLLFPLLLAPFWVATGLIQKAALEQVNNPLNQDNRWL